MREDEGTEAGRRAMLHAADLLLIGQTRPSDVGAERMHRIIHRLREVPEEDIAMTLCAVVAISADSIGSLTEVWTRGTVERDEMLWMLLSSVLDRGT